jgi:hypothetical protein
MSSSPPRSTRTTPRSTPKPRTPLQERTQSETNEISARLQRIPKQTAERNVYATSPFPTKPQQILLPSTIRKQKSSQNLYADIFAPKNGAASRSEPIEGPSSGKRPAVRLKRSVKTLRDMYEAQADDSRPGTALSSSRPGTSSSKLRSYSSSEGLSGRYAWENLKSVASDDLALLPSLPEGQSTLKRFESQSSFASRAAKHGPTSSPNFRVLGATSSPRIPVYHDLSEASSEHGGSRTTDPTSNDEGMSSPNFVKLGRSSSFDDSESLDPPSPTVTRLGISPARTVKAVPPSSPVRRSSNSSDSSRKRKRSDTDEGRSFAARAGEVNPFPSSPPLRPTVTEGYSSPLEPGSSSTSASRDVASDDVSSAIAESSPIVQVLQQDSSSIDERSVADTHASLQQALSSSPAPPIHYPVVRAPAEDQTVGIIITKRKYRSSHTTDSLSRRWPSRLTAPSQESLSRSRTTSRRSSWIQDPDESEEDSFNALQAYVLDDSANNSQIRIVPDSDRQEGEDEISALPGDDYVYGMPSAPERSTSYLGSNGSSQSRMGSVDLRLERLRSYSLSRQNSLRSMRPGSSSSTMTQLAVPTWARRYYSGFYPESFRFLAQSASSVHVNQVKPLPPVVQTRPESISTTGLSSNQSIQSKASSFKERISESLIRLRNRPRLEPRKSHSMPGVGPLVSNPIRREAATAAAEYYASGARSPRQSIRPVSLPMSLADPRAHWNGVIDSPNGPLRNIPETGLPQHPSPTHARPNTAGLSVRSHSFIYPHPLPQRLFRRQSSFSPHLHHDRRLNSSSTTSRGFGAPYNRKSYFSFSAPSVKDEPASSKLLRTRNVQVSCFVIGFVIPITWFVGAVLRLPTRPENYNDMEKRVSSHLEKPPHQPFVQGRVSTDPFVSPTNANEMDILSRLRMERQFRGSEEIMWQNVRWWRTLNRWMCVIGVLVLVLVIVLAVVGTLHWNES